MAKDIRTLTSERHYMGTSSAGKFATEGTELPRYDRRPTAAERRRMLACSPAYHARYLREQNVAALAVTCQAAKRQLEAGAARMERLVAALAKAREEGDAKLVDELEQTRALLEEHLDDTLQRRRRASQQLRVFGIDPQQEAAIADEFLRRAHRCGA